MELFSQEPYRCRLDWGWQGAAAAAERGNAIVVVDTLSFSSAVATAVHHGGVVYPCPWEADAAEMARRVGAEAAVKRRDVPHKGRFSLSPLSLIALAPGMRVVLPSPNGATCIRYGQAAPYLFVGALLNAEAVAAAVAEVLENTGLGVTIIACGERRAEPNADGSLRFALEDYLGAGAILSYLRHEKSPEARASAGAFGHVRGELEELLWECGSGRELRAMGFGGDVTHAARLNLYDSVPVLRGEFLEKLRR